MAGGYRRTPCKIVSFIVLLFSRKVLPSSPRFVHSFLCNCSDHTHRSCSACVPLYGETPSEVLYSAARLLGRFDADREEKEAKHVPPFSPFSWWDVVHRLYRVILDIVHAVFWIVNYNWVRMVWNVLVTGLVFVVVSPVLANRCVRKTIFCLSHACYRFYFVCVCSWTATIAPCVIRSLNRGASRRICAFPDYTTTCDSPATITTSVLSRRVPALLQYNSDGSIPLCLRPPDEQQPQPRQPGCSRRIKQRGNAYCSRMGVVKDDSVDLWYCRRCANYLHKQRADGTEKKE